MEANKIIVGNVSFTFPSSINGCTDLKLCDPEPEFDTIEKCRLCGRLL